jgi:hypothetical protein
MSMSPLEIITKAHFDSRHELAGVYPWDRQTREIKSREIKHMRAALLALAEAELPGQTLNEGAMAVTLEGPQRHKAREAFRAILRAIAEDRP